MFLKNLKIEKEGTTIRDITFHKGINLIVDETKTEDRTESGNNVGKTTVLRLIDYCFAGKGKNIYSDPEFKDKGNTQIKHFLTSDNVVITLTLKESLDDPGSGEVVIRRNFLTRKEKIREIDGKAFGDTEFKRELKELIFHSHREKPTIRQLVAKNIRDEKNKLANTLKVLHQATTAEEYEALFLSWLGIDLDGSDKKQKLAAQKRSEEKLRKRLREESLLPEINQSLIVVNRNIDELTAKKAGFDLNETYEADLAELNRVKADINRLSTKLSSLEFRKELIVESQGDLEREASQIDSRQVENFYREAKALHPGIQKSFAETLDFHNRMVAEKIKYITRELPALKGEISAIKRDIKGLLSREKNLAETLTKTDVVKDLQQTVLELNKAYEKKGELEELKKLWEHSDKKLRTIEEDLEKINLGIASKDDLIEERIEKFNEYFAGISKRLYGEQFVLSAEKTDTVYGLNITSIGGNLGTGKKKGQIAAFDLAYIQFADALNIDCLHFILHDQIENVHVNQISNLLTEIVSGIDCQYILPVLRDKLPDDIDVEQYIVLTLSQTDKLFRLA